MSLDRYFPPPKFPCALEEEEKEKSERKNKPEMEISRLWKKRSVLEVGGRGGKYRKTKPDTGGGGGGHPPRLSLPLQKISVISLAPPSLLSRLKFQEYSKRPGNANAMPDQKEGLETQVCDQKAEKETESVTNFHPLVFRAIQIFFASSNPLSLSPYTVEVTAKASDFEPPPSLVARFFP